jgi:hypothetical protein
MARHRRPAEMALSSNALASTLVPQVGNGPAGRDVGEGAREGERRWRRITLVVRQR